MASECIGKTLIRSEGAHLNLIAPPVLLGESSLVSQKVDKTQLIWVEGTQGKNYPCEVKGTTDTCNGRWWGGKQNPHCCLEGSRPSSAFAKNHRLACQLMKALYEMSCISTYILSLRCCLPNSKVLKFGAQFKKTLQHELHAYSLLRHDSALPEGLLCIMAVTLDGMSLPDFFAGDLTSCRQKPVVLDCPNKLVYTPHVWGPSICSQSYFADKTFPTNMASLWTSEWAHICSTKPLLGPACIIGKQSYR